MKRTMNVWKSRMWSGILKKDEGNVTLIAHQDEVSTGLGIFASQRSNVANNTHQFSEQKPTNINKTITRKLLK